MTVKLNYRKLRWFIVAWITLSTVLNLLCRRGLYLLAPVLEHPGQLNMSDASYAKVVSIFALAYAVMYTGGGRLVDWMGERLGLALALFVSRWSVSSGILCVNGSPLREGMKTPAILHGLHDVGQAAILHLRRPSKFWGALQKPPCILGARHSKCSNSSSVTPTPT